VKILDSHLQAREDERRRRAVFVTNNPPHLLSHLAVSFISINSTVDSGIESRSAILWLCYLVPLLPPFRASDEIHRFCFRRWVRFGSRCLCTPCSSTRRRVFRRRGNGWRRCGVLRYRMDFERRRGVNSSIRLCEPLIKSYLPQRIHAEDDTPASS